jgi:heat shock protein HslJ
MKSIMHKTLWLSCLTLLVFNCSPSKDLETDKNKTNTATNVSLTETYWRLSELMGKPINRVDGKKEVHMILKLDGNRVQGFLGCNSFNGIYTVEGNRITFSKMASTLKACIDMSDENELIEVLNKVDNFNINGSNLNLNKARMTPLAKFEAVFTK